MLAAVCRRYGPPDVLRIEEVAQPSPKAGEVLVRVCASTVTSGDVRMRAFTGAGIFWLPMRLLFGVLRARNPITGMECAGTVAAVGKGVTAFRVGEAVFGMKIGGANAEFLTIRETGAIAAAPIGLSLEGAAATPFSALSALDFLRDFARIQPGQRILIHGASGAVGMFAVQLAKHFGAHVTAVSSTANVDLVSSLGADLVIDYRKSDFTQFEGVYEAILDTIGGTSFSKCRRILAPTGRHVFVVQSFVQLVQALWTSMRPGKKVIVGFSGGDSQDDLVLIKRLIEAGEIKPVVDRTYPLKDIFDAHRYVDTGRKWGSVVVFVDVTPLFIQRELRSIRHEAIAIGAQASKFVLGDNL
jgi:NADPH:quinone reductase-like Zn-dependent oxidoreductase